MGELLSPEAVVARIPGMTKAKLAQLRFQNKGPAYYKPTPKTVVYDLEKVNAWLQSTLQEAG